jgi:hypothetical protein
MDCGGVSDDIQRRVPSEKGCWACYTSQPMRSVRSDAQLRMQGRLVRLAAAGVSAQRVPARVAAFTESARLAHGPTQ